MNKTADEVTTVPPPARGVYLRRYHARVIEDGNLLIVEFLDNERPRPCPDDVRVPACWHLTRTWGASLAVLARTILRSR